jgi:hypothetical protein
MLLRRGITSATAVLNMAAPSAWETLPVHIYCAVLYWGILAAHFLHIERGTNQEYHGDLFAGQNVYHFKWGIHDTISSTILHSQGKELLNIVDRAVGQLRSASSGRDFPTRGKMVLEALRSGTAGTAETGTDNKNSSRNLAPSGCELVLGRSRA